MKTLLFTGIFCLGLFSSFAQSTTAGNLQNLGQTNYIGFSNNYTIPFKTNNVNRMFVMGDSPAGSITGALGLGVAAPQAYFHLANNGSGAFTPNGLLFRTDGLSTIDNSWSFWLTTNGTLGEAFRIGNVQGGGRFRMGTVADRPLTMITNDVNRVTILDDNTQNPNDGGRRA